MSKIKKIRRTLESAAIVAGVDLGPLFAHGAKGVMLGELLAACVLCGIAASSLFDASLGVEHNLPERLPERPRNLLVINQAHVTNFAVGPKDSAQRHLA